MCWCYGVVRPGWCGILTQAKAEQAVTKYQPQEKENRLVHDRDLWIVVLRLEWATRHQHDDDYYDDDGDDDDDDDDDKSQTF